LQRPSMGYSAIDLEHLNKIEKYVTPALSEIQTTMVELTKAVGSIDVTMGKVLDKQEARYQHKYADFIEEKTKKLNLMIEQLNEKSSNRTLKDIKIGELQTLIGKLQREATLTEDMNQEKREDLKRMRLKLEQTQADRKFLYTHAREEKQKVRLLEARVKELEEEVERMKKELKGKDDDNREVNLRILKEMTL
jgi:hypothetical protein